MKNMFEELIQNKNFLMFSTTIVYVLGLFAYFSDKPIVLASIFTVSAIVLLIKEFSYKVILVWVAVFYFGFLSANYRIKNYDELFKLAPADAVITGQIVSVPNSSMKNNTKFFFQTEKVTSNGTTYNINNKTLVGINDFRKNPDFSNLVIGNKYEITGKLRRPFISTNPSQFSYAKYLRNFNTFTTFYADNFDVKPISSKLTPRWKLLQYLNNKRDDIIKTHSLYLKSPYLDILGGVVFGDDAIAPPDYIRTSFIHSGLLHILAASGMNVGFISAFLFFFMIRLNVPFRLMLTSGILVTILYCLMTGLGASVIRAGLMLIFIYVGKLFDRDAHSVALLSFVGMLMLIYNPAYINDVSFQLSFIVTLGIILTGEAVFKYVKNVPMWLSSGIFLPIIAQIWVIPIQMFYFNTISLYSVFANILSMPVLAVISFGGFLSSVLSLITPVAKFTCMVFDFVLNPCLHILVYISDFFAKLPYSLFYTTHPSVIQILLYYVILCIFVHLIDIGFKNSKAVKTMVCLSIVLLLSATIHIPNHNFEVISFDVGNADAFLLKTPQNKYFIIDTGKMGYMGKRSQADMLILKYLRDNGIKNIEGMIITHFDSDHAGGAVDLINALRVKKVYMNSLSDNKRLARQIYKTINKKSATMAVLVKDNTLIYEEPNFRIKVFKANIPQRGHDSEANENSVITLAENLKTSILFTGDAGVRAFNQIKYELPRNITILKVGHHGAKYVVDKEMLQYLNPKISLVSVGYNKYGHPHPLTIRLLSDTKIVRTDKIHAIKIISNDKGYEVDGYDSYTRKFYKKYKQEIR